MYLALCEENKLLAKQTLHPKEIDMGYEGKNLELKTSAFFLRKLYARLFIIDYLFFEV